MSWASFSLEIKWLILDHLRDFKCRQYKSPERHREHRKTSGISQAAYASVCREWSTFFEVANLEKLILHQDDITILGEIVPRCGARIRWISLRIELPSYDCSLCNQPELVASVKINKFIFTDAVWALFAILCKLNNSHHPGITLELSAHSPSLSDHYAQELSCMINDTAWHKLGGIQPPRSLNDRYHRWRSGHRRRITDDAALRMVGHPQGLRFNLRAPVVKKMNKVLPKVRVVTALVIRGQCYRHFSVPKALDPIIKNLTQLRDLSYECWEGYDTAEIKGQHIRNCQNCTLLSDTFKYRRSLRKISMYEGTSRCNARHLRRRHTWEQAVNGFGSALAKVSRNLDELYVNDIVEPGDFFRPFWESEFQERATRRILWRNLKRISLFGKLVPPGSYEGLIRTAGHAAHRMPQLQFMELWYCDKHYQCVFSYEFSQHAHDPHKLELRSSWGGHLGLATVQAWREAVHDRGPGMEIEIRGQGQVFRLPKGRDVMCALVLRGDCLTNSSQWQILGQHGQLVA